MKNMLTVIVAFLIPSHWAYSERPRFFGFGRQHSAPTPRRSPPPGYRLEVIPGPGEDSPNIYLQVPIERPTGLPTIPVSSERARKSPPPAGYRLETIPGPGEDSPNTYQYVPVQSSPYGYESPSGASRGSRSSGKWVAPWPSFND